MIRSQALLKTFSVINSVAGDVVNPLLSQLPPLDFNVNKPVRTVKLNKFFNCSFFGSVKIMTVIIPIIVQINEVVG